MRYTQLRAFHNVALHGGFSRAAGALNQTQPALSDQVRRLEQEYDTLLFYRDRKQIRMTAQGEGLFLLTKRLFEDEQNIDEYLGQSRAAIGGTLRIIADSAHHVTGALQRFRESFPNVFGSLRTGNSQEVLQKLRNYECEIGVVGSLHPSGDVVIHELGTTPIIAVAAKGFLGDGVEALQFRDLANYPLIFRETGSRTRLLLEKEAGRQKLALEPVIEVDGREAMREIVASGAGIGFLSAAEFGHDGRLQAIPLLGIDLQMSESLIYLSTRRDVPVIRAFARTGVLDVPDVASTR